MFGELLEEIEWYGLSGHGRKTFKGVLDVYRITPDRITSLKSELQEFMDDPNATMQARELATILRDGLKPEYNETDELPPE